MPNGHDQARIVVGVDDTAAGRHALAWAIEEAVLRGCAVEAVMVVSTEPPVDAMWSAEDDVRELFQDRLDKAVREVIVGRDEIPPVATKLVTGQPARALIDASRGAALLVVAAHQGQWLRKALFGSVSTTCVRHSTVPVVVVRPAGDQAAARVEQPKAGREP